MRKLKLVSPNAMFLATLIFTLAMASGQSRACCVYNHAKYPLKAQIDTGVFSNEQWEIGPTHHKCTNGKGGSAILQMMSADRKEMISDIINIEVDDHGWVSVFKKEGSSWKVLSKDKHGKVKHTKALPSW